MALILINILCGLLGIILYTLIKVWTLLKSDESVDFDLNIFFHNNKLSWLISSCIIVTFTIILFIVPDVEETVKNILPGYEMKNSPIGFLGLGSFLSFGTKTITRAYTNEDK